MIRLTVSDIAEKMDIDKEDARGLVRFLCGIGEGKQIGERKGEGGGKPANVYVFEDGFEKRVQAMLKKAEMA